MVMEMESERACARLGARLGSVRAVEEGSGRGLIGVWGSFHGFHCASVSALIVRAGGLEGHVMGVGSEVGIFLRLHTNRSEVYKADFSELCQVIQKETFR